VQKPALFYGALHTVLSQNDEVFPSGNLLSCKKKLLGEKQKYIKMYQHDIITIEELSEKNREISDKLQDIEEKLADPAYGKEPFSTFTEESMPLDLFSNSLLRRIFKNIIVAPTSELEIFLNSF
jgi:hypothetical protein